MNFLDWQKKCLSDRRLLDGGNMILSLPTGAGKTLIAELIILRELVLHAKNCLFMVPFIAIAQQKVHSLNEMSQIVNVMVEEYAASKGRLPPMKRRGRSSIYVATIEKANMLINSLILENRIHELGIVVIDELHMIGDHPRGAGIEQVIVKFMNKGCGQIVGISATLSNVDQVADFMKASVYAVNFRPVELIQKVKMSNALYRIDLSGRLVHEMNLEENTLDKRDPDGLVHFLKDVIPQGSIIIFCPTKKSCENVCKMITSLIPRHIRELKRKEKLNILAMLRDEQDNHISPVLEMAILAGVAYHHSGLTADERHIIEDAYQEGAVSILCSTSTLAAGVNLPAQRIILKAPLVGKEPIKKSQYLQMIGRAGRPGFGIQGDSIAILRLGSETDTFLEMLACPMSDCKSALCNNDVLSSFILDLISLKICSNKVDLERIISTTLFGIQHEDSGDVVNQAILNLSAKKLISIDKSGEVKASPIGDAAFTSNISPAVVQNIGNHLHKNLSEGIVLSSQFHLIYIIIPFDIYVAVDWHIFFDEYMRIPKPEQNLLNRLGFQESNLVKFIVSQPKPNAGDKSVRLYVAFIMQRIWKQESFTSIARRFSVTRGWLQCTLQSVCAQASSITRYSEKISELWPLKHLLPNFVQRLRECSHQELIPLLAIEGVKTGRARQLYEKGFKTIGDVAKADPETLIHQLTNLNRRQARAIVVSARNLMNEWIADKVEEMESMGITPSTFSF